MLLYMTPHLFWHPFPHYRYQGLGYQGRVWGFVVFQHSLAMQGLVCGLWFMGVGV